MVIGFGTLKLFPGERKPDRWNSKGRILTRVGEIAGRPAIATLHLSGARTSILDRELILKRVLEFIDLPSGTK